MILILIKHDPKQEQYHHRRAKSALPVAVQRNIITYNCIVQKTTKANGSFLEQLTFTKMMHIDDQFAMNQTMYLLLT